VTACLEKTADIDGSGILLFFVQMYNFFDTQEDAGGSPRYLSEMNKKKREDVRSGLRVFPRSRRETIGGASPSFISTKKYKPPALDLEFSDSGYLLRATRGNR
jgi:hypothetical protein